MCIYIGIRLKDAFFYTFIFCIKYTNLLVLPSKVLSKKEPLLKKMYSGNDTFQ